MGTTAALLTTGVASTSASASTAVSACRAALALPKRCDRFRLVRELLIFIAVAAIVDGPNCRRWRANRLVAY